MVKPPRIPVVYVIAIPLALVLGFLVSSPDPATLAMLAGILLLLALPLFFRWHHALLIVFWNSAFNAYFLPGGPDFWLLFALFSLAISILHVVMFQKEFLRVPEFARPLLFLAAVVVFTACYRGGIGLRIMGGASMGGKYYIYILGAILGYFALTAVPISIARSGRLAGLYFLSAASNALSNLAYALGPAFYFLYYFVPTSLATNQAASEYGLADIDRLNGLAPGCIGVFCFLLVRYGIRGLFDWAKPWRLFFLILTVGAAFFAGFRSALMVILLIFAIQFYLEGLLRTRLCFVLASLCVLSFVFLLFGANKLPLSVQRTLSFLPVPVDAEVRADAKGSSEWRYQMWDVVLKDVPKYLVIGKGYGIDPTDMFLTTEAIRMGLLSNFEEALLAGDYHNGTLSVLIPFGIFGLAAFLWLLWAGFRILLWNYRYGDAKLRRINRTLLAYYLTYCFSFFFIFGALNSQLLIFVGAVGLGVSLNGGVKNKPAAKNKLAVVPEIVVFEPG